MDCQTLSLSGFGWNATISAGSGANILLLTCHGEHVLRPLPNPCPDPYTVGSPLLFPANRTANGCFDYEGRKYALTVNDKKAEQTFTASYTGSPFPWTMWLRTLWSCIMKTGRRSTPFLFESR